MPENNQVIAEIGNVQIVGSVESVREKFVAVFRGVKYGEVRGRFEAAEPFQYAPNTVVQASKYGPVCMQDTFWHTIKDFGDCEPSENCFYLNVWSPIEHKSAGLRDRQLLRPVLVFLHGGGFYTGGSSISLYNAAPLAAIGDIVVVSLNYRLGPFGFLYTGRAAVSTNLGLKDQLLAIEWTKKNIEHFGGDSNKITYFGNCAGANSVGFFLTSRTIKIKRAIISSGSPLNPSFTDTSLNALRKTRNLLTMLGYQGARTQDCENEVNDEELNFLKKVDAHLLAKTSANFDVLQGTGADFFAYPWQPVVGVEPLVAQWPAKVLQNEEIQSEPELLTIATTNEGSLIQYFLSGEFRKHFNDSEKHAWINALKAWCKSRWPENYNKYTEKIVDMYFNRQPIEDKLSNDSGELNNYRRVFCEILGDYYLVFPTIAMGAAMSNSAKVYSANFSYRSKSDPMYSSNKLHHANHISDLRYIFGHALKQTGESDALKEDQSMCLEMIKVVKEFVEFGSCAWPRCDNADDCVSYNLDIRTADGKKLRQFRAEKFLFWKSLIFMTGSQEQ